MLNLGKNKEGLRVYFDEAKLAEAVQDITKFKGKLTNQQWARLRKYVNKQKKLNS